MLKLLRRPQKTLLWALPIFALQPLFGRPLPLWQAVSPGGSEIWLLGSVHVGDEDMFPLDPVIENAFQSSQRLVVELEVDRIDRDALMTNIEGKAKLPDDETLFELLPSDAFFRADAALAPYNIQMIDLNSYQPWYLLWLLSSLPSRGSTQFDPEQGIDMHFLRAARDRGMEVTPLETVDEQLAVFSGVPTKEQVELLSAMLKQLRSSPPEQLEDLIKTWKSGDTEALRAYLETDDSEDPSLKAFEERLLDDRNRRMAQKIEALAEKDQGELFVVVGALHLIGPGSVVDLLEQAGYSVEQQDATEALAK